MAYYLKVETDLTAAQISAKPDKGPDLFYRASDTGQMISIDSSGNEVPVVTQNPEQGTVIAAGTPMEINGSLSLGGSINYIPSMATIDNLTATDLNKSSILMVTTGEDQVTITGISAPTKNNLLILLNTGASRIKLSGQNVGSLASNRFNHSGFINVDSGQAKVMVYVTGINKWIVTT